MDIIDDEGNLFGLINIIDALVVLLVLSTVVAGIALVTEPDEQSAPNATDTEEPSTEQPTPTATDTEEPSTEQPTASATDTEEPSTEPPRLNVSLTVESTVHPSVAETLRVGAVIRGDKVTTTDADGNIRLVEHPTDKRVRLVLAVVPDTTGGVLMFQGQTVRVGERVDITFTDVSLDAVVRDIDRESRSAAT
jgi:cytoskeletal protein RodZ